MEVYCEGELVRRISVHRISLKRRKEQYDSLMHEVTMAYLSSGKQYHVDLLIEEKKKANENDSTKESTN